MSSPTGLRDNVVAPQTTADPRYAWVMLPLAMLMQIGTSPGQTFGVSLFSEPIRQSLGLSQSWLSGSYMVASLLAAVPLMAIGRRMDRHGLRWMTLGLVAMVGAACFAMSRASGIVGLTMGFLLLRTFGQGGLSLAASNTLGMWFVRRLGLASGLCGVGMAAAVAFMPLAYHELIEGLGWRNAYVAISLFTLFGLLPLLVLFYRDNPELEAGIDAASGQPNDTDALAFELGDAMRTPAYWIVAACTAMIGLISTGVTFSLVSLFSERGFTAAQAASVFPTVAIAMAALQIKGGLLADRLPLHWLVASAMGSFGCGVVLLCGAQTMFAAQVAMLCLGAGQGLLAVTGNTLWPRYFGRKHLGAIRSSVWTATVAMCSAGPFIMGMTFDFAGGYEPSLWLFAVLAAACCIAAAGWAKPPKRSKT